MFRTISALVIGLAIVSSAFAADEVHSDEYFTVKNVKLSDVTEKYAPFMDLYSQPGLAETCTSSGRPLRGLFSSNTQSSEFSAASDLDPLAAIDVILDQIINIGKKIWAIVDAGKPVVNLKFDTANALPRGTTCWDDLGGWTAPNTHVYQVDYKNLYGMTVVNFAFRVSFTANGNVNGVGKYLTNASFMPAQLSVAWGYNFDASADIPSVLNQGTKEAPVAGMQMNMNWKVSTPLKQSQKTESFFASGDNTFQHLQ